MSRIGRWSDIDSTVGLANADPKHLVNSAQVVDDRRP